MDFDNIQSFYTSCDETHAAGFNTILQEPDCPKYLWQVACSSDNKEARLYALFLLTVGSIGAYYFRENCHPIWERFLPPDAIQQLITVNNAIHYNCPVALQGELRQEDAVQIAKLFEWKITNMDSIFARTGSTEFNINMQFIKYCVSVPEAYYRAEETLLLTLTPYFRHRV